MLQVASSPVGRSVLKKAAPIVAGLAFKAAENIADKVASKIAGYSQPKPRNIAGTNYKNNARGRKQRRRAQKRGRRAVDESALVEMKTRTAPARVGFDLKFGDNNFRMTTIKHPQHGAGVVVDFATMFAQVVSNGVAAANDKAIPISLASMHNIGNASGFLTADLANVSGFQICPGYLGHRLETLNQLYQRWQPLKVMFHYIPMVGTSTNGNLVMAFTNDPVQLIESDGTWGGTLVPSVINMSQNSPVSTGPLWDRISMDAGKFDPSTMYYTSFDRTGSDVKSNTNYGDMAFLRQFACGRFGCLTINTPAAAPQGYGYLWISGSFVFYNNSAGTEILATTTGNPSLLDKKSPSADRRLYCTAVKSGVSHDDVKRHHDSKTYAKFYEPSDIKTDDIKSQRPDGASTYADILKRGPIKRDEPDTDPRDGWQRVGRRPRSIESLSDYAEIPLKEREVLASLSLK
jgi:hypothetical protein